jgi:hypothetical protein
MKGPSIMATSTSSTEKQLLGLFERLEPILREWLELKPIYEAAFDAAEREIARRTGIPAGVGFRSETEVQLYFKEQARVYREQKIDELSERREALDRRIDPILDAIRQLPARSLAGLAIKARAVAVTMDHLWDVPANDLDWEEEFLRDLIENVCALAGVNLPAVQNRRRSTAILN